MRTWEEISKLFAQIRMKWYTNLKRKDKQYVIGDMVCLRLQPYKQNSLAAQCYSPFKILHKMGSNGLSVRAASRFKSPWCFHVSLLKKQHEDYSISTHLPFLDEEGQFLPQPLAALTRRMKKKRNKPITSFKQWKKNKSGGLCGTSYRWCNDNFLTSIRSNQLKALWTSPFFMGGKFFITLLTELGFFVFVS